MVNSIPIAMSYLHLLRRIVASLTAVCLTAAVSGTLGACASAHVSSPYRPPAPPAHGVPLRVPATYYVSPYGHNRGRCQVRRPCLSMRYATRLTRPGDTVVVARGTYRGNQVIVANGAPGHRITVRGSGHTVLTRSLPARDQSQQEPLLTISDSSNVTVEGLMVKGMKGRADYKPADTNVLFGEVDVAGAMGSGAGIVLQHLTVEHANFTCIKQEDDEQYETIQNNTLTDCGAPGNTREHGIYLSGGHNTVSGNTITTVSGYGIQTYQTSSIPVDYETIVGNTVRGAKLSGILSDQGPSTIAGNFVSGNQTGIEASAQGGNAVILQNVISQNTVAGLTLHADASGGQYLVENNTFYNNTYEEMGMAGSGSPAVTLLNNIFSGNNDMLLNGALTASSVVGYNDYYNVRLPTTVDIHSITADPLFVIPGVNFSLQAGSPAIGAGTDTGLPFAGPAPDLGANAEVSLAGPYRRNPQP